MKKDSTISFYYFFDTLCGWCYGFSSVIQKIYCKYSDDYDFEIISGGLNLGEKVGAIGIIAPYIKQGAWKQVANRTGAPFGDGFLKNSLEEGSMILNSLPPAIAMSIVKNELPEKSFEFGNLLHKAVFEDGLHPEDNLSYGKYAELVGFDAKDFTDKMQDANYIAAAKSDFERTRELGVTGYPTILLKKGERFSAVNSGYQEYGQVSSTIEKYLFQDS